MIYLALFILIICPILSMTIGGLLREITMMIRYRHEYMRCLRCIANPSEDEFQQIQYQHKYYYLGKRFSIRASGGRVYDTCYNYYIKDRDNG